MSLSPYHPQRCKMTCGTNCVCLYSVPSTYRQSSPTRMDAKMNQHRTQLGSEASARLLEARLLGAKERESLGAGENERVDFGLIPIFAIGESSASVSKKTMFVFSVFVLAIAPTDLAAVPFNGAFFSGVSLSDNGTRFLQLADKARRMFAAGA